MNSNENFHFNASAPKNEFNFQILEDFLEKNNTINMYISLILVIFGFIGNILAFIVFLYSQKRLPKIIGLNYLTLLTVINTVYLLIHFYISTLNRLIYHFKLENTDNFLVKIYHYDTSAFSCKMVSYFRYFARFLNAMLTLSFSLERAFAIYFPLQMRTKKIKSSLIFKFAILISFIIPTYLLFLSDKVPIEENNKLISLSKAYNFSSNFNLLSIRPTFQNYFCSVTQKNLKILFNFHAITFLLILMAYFIVGVAILAIVIKLKKRDSFKFSYRSRSYSREMSYTNESLLTNSLKNQTIQIKRSIKQKETKYKRKKKQIIFINQKFHNTKMLLSISASFVCLNLPYFLAMFLMFALTSKFKAHTEIELMEKLKLKSYIIMAELLQLANFSITGFLFFCSGRIFRMHFYVLLRKILLFLKNEIYFVFFQIKNILYSLFFNKFVDYIKYF